MIFNSVTFLLFFTLVTTFYWTLPSKPRMWFLFIASLIFYGFWKWEYLAVILLSAATDYWVARKLDDTPTERGKQRQRWLALSLTVNLGLLMYFKYLLFFTENFNVLFETLGSATRFPYWNIVLPFGISFYTFETISYTIDVYRGHLKAEREFIHYGLFVAFFPKLVAGPIQRASELINQLKVRPAFDKEFIQLGLNRMLQGLFLKVVLADNLSPIVDEGFAVDPILLSGIDVLTLSFLFGFQIYFDFSAYSHIALGAALVLGIQIPENFNYPYIASSLRDFWKRWHISLSSWIRDYLYLPLNGVKVTQSSGSGGIGDSLENQPTAQRRNLALFATWAIMGFWHGANWTFILWGLYHATFIFLERKLKPLKQQIPIFAHPMFTWPLVLGISMMSWIPFRAETLQDTFIMYGRFLNPATLIGMNLRENSYLVAASLMLLFTGAWATSSRILPKLRNSTVWGPFRIAQYALMVTLVLVFLRPINQFIYFQF
ncbi:MAG: alginate O-acetyltransferase [Crocinitomicaceae bacterium]|nr:alginate O-acetyltransferase [Crocinitomicaceae bacterium]